MPNQPKESVNCPHCQSEDTARCAMVYAQGTSTGGISATGASYGASYRYEQTFGTTSSSTTLAKVVAPPERWRLGQLGCLNLIVTVVLSLPAFLVLNWLAPNWPPNSYLMMVPGALLLPFFLVYYIKQRIGHRAAVKAWAATWMCLRCGHQWIPQGDQTAL